jgi:hypothetical protein
MGVHKFMEDLFRSSSRLANFVSPRGCTANEGQWRIKYICLVQIYVFPEMKLRGLVQNRIIMFCLSISTFMYV